MKKEMFFLKLDGVRGESNLPRHPGEMELLDYTWDVKHQDAGAPVKASTSDLTVIKQSGNASPELLVASATGKIFSEGLLTVELLSKSGGLLQTVIYKLKSVMVDAFHTGVHDRDSIHLRIERVETKIS